MKKLLTLAALAAFAGAAQAATLSWQLMGNKLPSGDAGSMAAFLFITSQSQDFGATVTSADDVTDILDSGSLVVVKDGSGKVTGISDGTSTINVAAAGATTTAGGLTGATGYGGGSWTTGDSLSGFVVMFDTADAASANKYIVSSGLTANWPGPGGAQTLRFGTVAPANANWKPITVPEPSVALMGLLGLGMMLKRRRA